MTDPAAASGFYDALLEDDPDELYENAPSAFLSTQPDGTVVKVNRTFLAWTGYERDTLLGRRKFQQLLAPGDRIYYETHFAPLLRMQGQIREIAVELVCESGERLPVIVNSVLKYDAAGAPVVVRTALFDATERRSWPRMAMNCSFSSEASRSACIAVSACFFASRRFRS